MFKFKSYFLLFLFSIFIISSNVVQASSRQDLDYSLTNLKIDNVNREYANSYLDYSYTLSNKSKVDSKIGYQVDIYVDGILKTSEEWSPDTALLKGASGTYKRTLYFPYFQEQKMKGNLRLELKIDGNDSDLSNNVIEVDMSSPELPNPDDFDYSLTNLKIDKVNYDETNSYLDYSYTLSNKSKVDRRIEYRVDIYVDWIFIKSEEWPVGKTLLKGTSETYKGTLYFPNGDSAKMKDKLRLEFKINGDDRDLSDNVSEVYIPLPSSPLPNSDDLDFSLTNLKIDNVNREYANSYLDYSYTLSNKSKVDSKIGYQVDIYVDGIWKSSEEWLPDTALLKGTSGTYKRTLYFPYFQEQKMKGNLRLELKIDGNDSDLSNNVIEVDMSSPELPNPDDFDYSLTNLKIDKVNYDETNSYLDYSYTLSNKSKVDRRIEYRVDIYVDWIFIKSEEWPVGKTLLKGTSETYKGTLYFPNGDSAKMKDKLRLEFKINGDDRDLSDNVSEVYIPLPSSPLPNSDDLDFSLTNLKIDNVNREYANSYLDYSYTLSNKSKVDSKIGYQVDIYVDGIWKSSEEWLPDTALLKGASGTYKRTLYFPYFQEQKMKGNLRLELKIDGNDSDLSNNVIEVDMSSPKLPIINQATKINNMSKLLSQSNLDELLSQIDQQRNQIREQEIKIKYLKNFTTELSRMSANMQTAINAFITYGVDDNTKKLGEGERAAVINSYQIAYDKLPNSESDLNDVIKIANGHWPDITNINTENKAKIEFRNIYKREANMKNDNDNAAVIIMAYGLRQRAENRNLNSESAGLKIFGNIFKRMPQNIRDWNILQAITYSGATR